MAATAVAQRGRRHVEGHLHQWLSAQDAEGEGTTAYCAEDKQIGGQEDQSDEERDLLEHEVDVLPAVVQRTPATSR